MKVKKHRYDNTKHENFTQDRENLPSAPTTTSSKVRLNKYIAQSGAVSRRKADEAIRLGEVKVNGKTVDELGTQINPRADLVVMNGKPIRPFQDQVYVMFNKPPRIITTMNDPEGRPSVADYFAKARVRMFPVGRLDWDSEGLLILTNDGDFAQRVSHPKNDVAKTYMVKVDGQPTHEHLQKLVRGVSIIGGKSHALFAEKAERSSSDKYDWIKVIINEGRNRQIRQMFEKIGFDVMKLQRIAVGRLKIGTLEKGMFRILTDEDLSRIFAQPKELDERNQKRAEWRKNNLDADGERSSGGRPGRPARRPSNGARKYSSPRAHDGSRPSRHGSQKPARDGDTKPPREDGSKPASEGEARPENRPQRPGGNPFRDGGRTSRNSGFGGPQRNERSGPRGGPRGGRR